MTIFPTVKDQLVQAAELRVRGAGRGLRGYPRGLAWGRLITVGASIVALTVAVGALVLLGGHHSSPNSTVPAAPAGSGNRHELLRTLGVLRTTPGAADRRLIGCANRQTIPRAAVPSCASVDDLPSVFMMQRFSSSQPNARASLQGLLAAMGYPRMDTSLIRTVPVVLLDVEVTFVPITWQPSRRSAQRQEGIQVTIHDPIGSGMGTGPTSLTTLQNHGIALSAPLGSAGGLGVVIVVPDGVAKVELQPIKLLSTTAPSGGTRFKALTARASGNLSVFRFPIPAAARRQTLRTREVWFDASGRVIRRMTTLLGVN
jgi:hypothetical protein